MIRGPEVLQRVVELWNEGRAKLEEALQLARDQGFTDDDRDDMSFALQHVGVMTREQLRTEPDPRARFQRVQEDLWRDLRQSDPKASERYSAHIGPNAEHRYLGWVLCPRAHAKKYLVHTLESKGKGIMRVSVANVKSLFAAFDRFFDGEDLVFALGEVQ